MARSSQPFLAHVTTIFVPLGDWTSSRLSRVNRPLMLPLIWISTPDRSFSGRLRTVTVFEAIAVAPRSSVTRRRTVNEPTLVNFVLITAPLPSSNWPSLSRSQLWATSGPSESPEVEARTAVSPANRLAGDTVKPARGGELTVTVR